MIWVRDNSDMNETVASSIKQKLIEILHTGEYEEIYIEWLSELSPIYTMLKETEDNIISSRNIDYAKKYIDKNLTLKR
jgi:hypothetical protein